MIKNNIINCLKGAAIGVSMIIPGVSGGTIAVSLNIYEDLINAIGNLRKEFKKSILFLLPILIGMILAFAAMYYPLKLALKYIPFEITCVFAGLMIGSFPKLYMDTKKNGFKKIDIISIIIPFLVVVGLCFINGLKDVNLASNMQWYQWVLLLLVGALGSCALVVPGISGSLLLVILGYYQPILNMVSELKNEPLHAILVLGVFALGMVIGFFTIAKLMKFLISKFRRTTYWAIMGFFIGSIIALFISFDYKQIDNITLTVILSIVLFVVSTAASYLLTRYVDRKNRSSAK